MYVFVYIYIYLFIFIYIYIYIFIYIEGLDRIYFSFSWGLCGDCIESM